MEPSTVFALATKATEHGATFLGEDLVGWRTALIAAIPAAIIYEIAMALARKITLRLPFLVLQMARAGVRADDWHPMYAEWRAELWFLLRDRDAHWLVRFFNGMRFSIPLALGGARRTAKVDAAPRPRRQVSDYRGPRELARNLLMSASVGGSSFVLTIVLGTSEMLTYILSFWAGAATLIMRSGVDFRQLVRRGNGGSDVRDPGMVRKMLVAVIASGTCFLLMYLMLPYASLTFSLMSVSVGAVTLIMQMHLDFSQPGHKGYHGSDE